MDNQYEDAKEATEVYRGDSPAGMLGGALSPKGIRNPPVRKIVEMQIAEYKAMIKQREELLAALDANPGIEDVLDKLKKIHL